MKKSNFLLTLLTITTLFLATSCSTETTETLDVNSLSLESYSVSKEQLIYKQNSVINFDLGIANLDDFEINWEASGGTFSNTTKNQATWKAPSTKGTYEVFVNVTHKGITKQLKVTNLTVVGAFYDPLTFLNNAIWSFNTATTSYEHIDKSLEVKPKQNQSYSTSVIKLKSFLGSNNKIPQSISLKTKAKTADFKEDSNNYVILYGFKKPTNVTSTDKYLRSIRFRIFPKTQRYLVQLTIYNQIEEKDEYINIRGAEINNTLWNNDDYNDIGLQISENFELNFYINKNNIYTINISNYLTRQNIIHGAQNPVEYLYIFNYAAINISEVIIDNTSQGLYDYDNHISL
ncbi:hypothetical protein [Wenyingzhuangia sp. IMCC45574]